MKSIAFLALGVLLAAGVVLARAGGSRSESAAPVVSAPETPRVESVRWLAGCWARTGPGGSIEESWMPPRGGTMLAVNRTVRGDSTVAWEFIRVFERDGRLVYEANPSGQRLTEFTEEESGDASITFANPEHDFPQRISYRASGDTLHARIEGESGGEVRGADFPLARVACP